MADEYDNASFQTEEASLVQDKPELPVTDGNAVFPMPCKRFIAKLVHTEHEVYSKMLTLLHGRENHTESEWWDIISGHADEPAHPLV